MYKQRKMMEKKTNQWNVNIYQQNVEWTYKQMNEKEMEKSNRKNN